MKYALLLLPLFLSLHAAWAESLALGPVYSVIEPDLLTLLKEHAREESQRANSRINQNRNRLENWAKAPQGTSLPAALETKRHRFDSNPEVRAFIGPDYQREWLFIDADHLDQIELAGIFTQGNSAIRRVILVSGSVEKTQKTLEKRVWFDQAGALIRRLKIEALPAFVQMDASGISVTQAPVSQLLKEKGFK